MFCGLFELHDVSDSFKTVHRICLVSGRIFFLYVGNMLQILSLMDATSVAEITTILAVSAGYINVAAKAAVFASKRHEIEKLWHRLEDDDFKAKTVNELRWANLSTNLNMISPI